MDINNKEYLDQVRHSCAHLLAAAVMELYPSAKRTIGPAIENGFYYDFDFGDTKISEEDLPKIEEKMRQILKTWKGFEKEEVTPDEAKKRFTGNPYKLELINEFAKDGQTLTIYKSGDFEDLCRGGHSENPQKDIGALKLLSTAGAYWRGDEKNKMLTRIYGTCFAKKEQLEHYLWQLEEAKKRDHRKLGRELDLFSQHDLVGPGLILWHPKGTIIREEIENFAKVTERRWGYSRVVTPHIGKKELFETSGHLPYYADSMFPPMKLDDGEYYMKAMNCPMTHLIYKNSPHSYRDLPIRLAEYGSVYRHELSGTLAGLLRVRGFTQNDAHIYCTKDQIKEEFKKVMELHKYYYEIFGITDYYMRLSLHDPENKEKYMDEPELWKFSEAVIREAMQESGLKYEEAVGEAAFYGPKIDFQIRSAIGREESASTNQLDFIAASRFGLNYIDTDGQEKPVFVIHRAPLGSHERFVAFLIEHYAGAFPVWLCPTQATVLPISDKFLDYARKVTKELEEENVRVELDERNERLQAKIRDATLQKIPYLLIVGSKEEENNQVSPRTRSGKDLGQVSVEEFKKKIVEEIKEKLNV